MACFAVLPNEILENVFQYLDFKNRKTLSLVCKRWNDVLLSQRYLKKHVKLHIEGNRLLDTKWFFSRHYQALSLKLDDENQNEMIKNLKMIHTFCPKPVYLRLENWSIDQRLGWIFEDAFFKQEDVEELHLVGTCMNARGCISISLPKLRMLQMDILYPEYIRIVAPKLNELCLHIRSEDHMDLLSQFSNHLVRLKVVFDSKDIYHFYHLKFPNVLELSLDRRLKGMTKSEQDNSIAFFKRMQQLQKLHLSVKFIDSYVMQTISCSILNLTDLTLEVSEGTIELMIISKLSKLESLVVAAEKINLLDARFPRLRRLQLGSPDFHSGTFVFYFENLMLFDNLRTIALHNVKFYPEVLKLTPSYSIEIMYIMYYKRLEETYLQILVKRFPAVRWLRVAYCPGFTPREVEKLKRMNPKLCVAFDEVSSNRLR